MEIYKVYKLYGYPEVYESLEGLFKTELLAKKYISEQKVQNDLYIAVEEIEE